MTEALTTLVELRSLDDITLQDHHYIKRACEVNYIGAEPRHVVFDAAQGTAQIFRLEGKAEGIVITRIVQHPSGRELSIWGIAGKGIFPRQVRFVAEELSRYGADNNCKWLTFVNLHKSFDPIYSRVFGDESVEGTFFRKEIEL